jgi:hypothetical protein
MTLKSSPPRDLRSSLALWVIRHLERSSLSPAQWRESRLTGWREDPLLDGDEDGDTPQVSNNRNSWRRGDAGGLHKPLLVLPALVRIEAGADWLIPFVQPEGPLPTQPNSRN